MRPRPACNGIRAGRFRALAAIARAGLILALLSAATTSAANTIAVFGDANMFPAFPAAGNRTLLDNLLGLGNDVLVSRQTAGFTPSLGIENHYGSLPGVTVTGVTVTTSSAALTAGTLAGVDLLVLDIEFAQPSPYDASEIGAVLSFLGAGGSVAVIAEHDSVSDYNVPLAGIGSAIRFTGDPRCCDLLHAADTILPASLTAGVVSFELGAASPLTGGVAAIQDQGLTLVAFEPLPEPGLPPPGGDPRRAAAGRGPGGSPQARRAGSGRRPSFVQLIRF